ncbi:MAG: ExbD/TolR family protein [Flavobacteriales bacterium]
MLKRKKREGPGEVNAGSMADIAFLLLIFFLVTTTMDMDEGILRQLPPPVPDDFEPPQVEDRNIFVVKVNAQDQLLVENEPLKISELKEKTKEFFTNPQNKESLPKRQKVTKASAKKELTQAKAHLKKNPESKDAKKAVEKAKEKLQAVKLLGGYSELPDDAMISLRNDRGTSYEMYIQVQNELEGAINELRNNLSQQKFGVKYSVMKPNVNEKDKKRVKSIRKVYPQRISEAEPIDVGSR